MRVCGGVVGLDVSCNSFSDGGVQSLAEYLKVQREGVLLCEVQSEGVVW